FSQKKIQAVSGGQKKDTQKLDESETIIAVSPFQNKQMKQNLLIGRFDKRFSGDRLFQSLCCVFYPDGFFKRAFIE
ncbi:MAG: hypothetical protein VST69_05325, partial [Nitrospirota bacterium]|nr:hypothetical protein [Nitrospirota bacterium]